LAEIAGIHNANHATERKNEDHAFHFAAPARGLME
jgi:hypothetical protein